METNPARRVLITGSDGLLGWHFKCYLETRADLIGISCNRRQFNDPAWLAEQVALADIVVHFAGVNRGTDGEVRDGNAEITARLLSALRATDSRPHLIYSSSTHVDRQTVYGQSKRETSMAFSAWAEAEDARFCNLVLPHIFGELGRPFYNSVVSTFAYQLMHGEPPHVENDGQLNLLHAYELATQIGRRIDDGAVGSERLPGTPIRVTQLHRRLQRLSDRYLQGVIPDLRDPLDLQLFNTLRSYVSHERRPVDLTLHSDPRGSLFEAIRCDGPGQVFLSTTVPGITRGNHFHTRKVERFLVVQGEALIRIRRIGDDAVQTFAVNGHQPQAIDIPTFHTHNITNVGSETLLTLFWAGEHFDPADSDTFAMDVEAPSQSPEKGVSV